MLSEYIIFMYVPILILRLVKKIVHGDYLTTINFGNISNKIVFEN